MSKTNNYTLGRGEVHFGQYTAGTTIPRGELYLGNTPDFKLSVSPTNLDHFNSDRGVKQKDNSILLQIDRNGQITTDNVDADNLALFFFGSKTTTAISSATGLNETFTAVEQGRTYQIGTSSSNPSGLRDLTSVVVTDGAGTPVTYVITTDYTVDLERGRVVPVVGGAITGNMKVAYGHSAYNIDRVISSNNVIEGALRFISYNPEGKQQDYFMPWVKITPNGDFALKSDAWQQVSFNIQVLEKTKDNLQAVYLDGLPYTS